MNSRRARELWPVIALCAFSGAPLGCEGDAKASWDSHTQGLPFIFGYEEGRAQAEKAGRPAMYFVTTTWCGYCKKLAGESFPDPEVKRLLGRFVLVIVDGDREKEAARSLGAKGFPYVVFRSSSGRDLGIVKGYVPLARFRAAVEKALAAAG